jgi:hypothetical protein
VKTNSFTDGVKVGALAQGLLIAIGLVVGMSIGAIAGGVLRR